MRRSTAFTWLLVVLLPTACVDPTWAQSSNAASRFDSLFTRTLEKRETIRSIHARFTETTMSDLLEKPLVAHGTLVAAPPMRVLMTYTEPERRTVLIDTGLLVVEWPDRGERQQLDIRQMQKRIDRYFAQASVAQLRSMFDLTVQPDTTIRNADRVDMVPTRKEIKLGLAKLRLWIDRETLLLVQMEMTFQGGDVKTIRLEDVTLNAPIENEMQSAAKTGHR